MLKNKKHCKLAKIIGISGLALSFIMSGASLTSSLINITGNFRYIKSMVFIDTKLDTSKGDIKINLYDFTDEEKAIVKDSIKEIDDLSSRINYVFSDEEDISTNQVINIYNNIEFKNSKTAGDVDLRSSFFTINIQYPININLREGLINSHDENDKSATLLSHVVKHEIMHTLGFNGLGTDRWLGKSIMYYDTDKSSDYGVVDLTELDKKDIIERYGE